MAKVLTIGSICQDIFFPTDEGVLIETPEDLLAQKKVAFELGSKYAITQRFETLGGNSTNVAIGLAKLGEDVCICAVLGDDSTGKWALNELSKTGVDTSSVKVQQGCKSDLSAILVDENSSDRIIFSNHEASGKLIVEDGKIGSPNWIFVGDLSGDWQENIDRIIEIAKKHKSAIAFNPRQKTIHDDVKKIIYTISKCEMLFLNKDEAIEVVSGCGDITVRELLENEEYLMKVLHRLGAKTVVITDGERGAWGWDGHQMLHAEAVMQKAVDSTGAGDAFTSGFFAARVKGKKLEECLRWGIANSSNSVTEYGGQAGLLSEKEIENMANSVIVKSIS